MQKSQIALIAILLVSSVCLFNLSTENSSSWAEKSAFESWKQQLGKSYNSLAEQRYRYEIFYKNYVMVRENSIRFDKQETVQKLALNHFSDLTTQQFAKMYLSENRPSADDFKCTGPQAPPLTKFDPEFNLDPKMINPNVGTQGQCKSGYAFATIAAVQSSMYSIFKQMNPMSAQQLVDCSKQTGNKGCEGGSALNALQYLMKRGTMKNSDYNYTGQNQDCKYNAAKKIWEVDNCTTVQSGLDKIRSAVHQQPVIVGFDATDSKFIQYGAGGLYQGSSTCGKNALNHYMVVTGWGEETKGIAPATKTFSYLVAKNSFGPAWGDKGYVKIVYQTKTAIKTEANNACGIMKEAYFPYG